MTQHNHVCKTDNQGIAGNDDILLDKQTHAGKVTMGIINGNY